MNHNELLSLIKASQNWELSFDETLNSYMGDENKANVKELLKATDFPYQEKELDSPRGYYNFYYFPVEEFYICLRAYVPYDGYDDEGEIMFMDIFLTERKCTLSYHYARRKPSEELGTGVA